MNLCDTVQENTENYCQTIEFDTVCTTYSKY